MSKIHDWTIQRSGPRLRVIGKSDDGNPVILTGVERVTRSEGGVVVAVRNTSPVETVVLA